MSVDWGEPSNGGVLSFNSSPDYESPHDSNGDNVYRVTVWASDDRGGVDDRNVTITVTDVDETVNRKPIIELQIANQTLTLGTTGMIGLLNKFSDPDDDDLTYTAGSSNTGVVTATIEDETLRLGTVSTGSATVTVKASDGSLSVEQTFSVTVNPRPTPRVTVTGTTTISYAENGTGVVATYSASPSNVSWSLSGDDGSHFNIDSSGNLGFVSPPPDFESPQDLNRDNRYRVTVKAGRSGYRDGSRTVTVNVTNVDEPGTVTLSTTTPSVGVEITASLSDPDGGVTDRSWQWWTSSDGGSTWVSVLGARSNDYTPKDKDAWKLLKASVRYRDAQGPNKSADSLPVTVEGPPARVVGLTGTPGPAHGEITLTWDPADGATGYEVQQKKPRPFLLPDEWITLPFDDFKVEITGTGAVVRNLDPDETYEHEVRGVNAHGEGEWSKSVRTDPHDERPDTPQGLEWRSTVGNRGISLSWQTVADAGEYEVESSFGGRSTTTTVSTTSVEFMGLTPEALYVFRVRAWKPYGVLRLHSDWSDAFRVRAPTPESAWGAHQADHVGAYSVDASVNEPILSAISPSASHWNSKLSGTGLSLCNNADQDCKNANIDGDVSPIVVEVSTPDDNTTQCGKSVACVAPQGGIGKHVENVEVVFKNPPYGCTTDADVCRPAEQVVYTWTTDPSKDHTDVGKAHQNFPNAGRHLYIHAGHLMLHELGHILAAPDFYSDSTSGLMAEKPAIMNIHWEAHTVQNTDVQQLIAIYRTHTSHK